MPFVDAVRASLQVELNNLIGNEVVLKLHGYHPGVTGTENLLFGTGLPKRYVFDKPDAETTWSCRDIPVENRVEGEPCPSLNIHSVTMWNLDDVPLMIVDLNSGGPWTIGPPGSWGVRLKRPVIR